MYIESIPNRNSPAAVLLRESYRQDGKVRKRTLANLSCLPDEVIEGLKVLLRGGVAVPSIDEVFTVERTLPHGHVAAVLGAARGAGASAWFASAPQKLQPLLMAMLVARVISPASKLATHRLLHDDTASTSLGRVLGVGQCSADDLYRALDWLHEVQPAIERRLARQHLVGSTLVLYDLTSAWLTVSLATFLKLIAPVFALVGAVHLALGVSADVLLGAKLPPEALGDATLNSQNRFYGIAFSLYGVLFYLCATDIRKYATVLRCVIWVFFAAGVARLVSIATHGKPSVLVLVLLASELAIPPLLHLWLARTLCAD